MTPHDEVTEAFNAAMKKRDDAYKDHPRINPAKLVLVPIEGTLRDKLLDLELAQSVVDFLQAVLKHHGPKVDVEIDWSRDKFTLRERDLDLQEWDEKYTLYSR